MQKKNLKKSPSKKKIKHFDNRRTKNRTSHHHHRKLSKGKKGKWSVKGECVTLPDELEGS
jgi:hypothetical protein